MNTNYKAHALFLCVIPILLLSLVALINYAVDPLQLFRVNASIGLYKNQRFQNSGLIISYLNSDMGYDSIFIGTSLSENFDTERAYGDHEIRALRLTMVGGYWKEHEIVATAALETGKVKRVFWELWGETYMNDNKMPFRSTKGFPEKLYSNEQDGLTRAFSYLINGMTSTLSFDLLKNGKFNEFTPDDYSQWMHEHIVKGHFLDYNSAEKVTSLAALVKTQREKISRDKESTTNLFVNIDRLLLLIDAYPMVRFDLFVPPVSLVANVGETYWPKFANYVRYVSKKLAKRPNAHLFSFATLKGIVNNNANYEDTVHYGQGVNDFMMEEMLNGRNEITPRNVEKHIDIYYEMLLHWPFVSDYSSASSFRPDQLMLLQK